MSRILIFDWTAGGHHELYLERVACALPDGFAPLVAAPSSTAHRLRALGIESISLGDPRPRLDTARHLRRDVTRIATHELALFREAIDTSRAEHSVHMFADGILRQFLTTPTLPTKATVLLFRPRAHYPALYHTQLSPRVRILASAYELIVRRWRQRPDAHAVLTLDDGAAYRWAGLKGAPAIWLPEPPVITVPPTQHTRRGAVLFGSLGPRKGLDRLANAALVDGRALSLTVAGAVVPGFEETLRALTGRLRSRGVKLELRGTWHDERAGIALLARHRCVVLPYVGHYGMSRVLLEAASSGIPVVTPNYGLLGHLVSTYNIGITVNIESATELRGAIDILCHDDERWDECHAASARFAERYSPKQFAAALAAAFLQDRDR